MTSTISFSGKDYGGEKTTVGMYLGDVSAASYDARITSIAALLAAINNVTYGDFTGQTFNAVKVAVGAKATDDGAQRERKWRVTYTDDVNPVGNGGFEIGMADSQHLASDSENMDVSGGVGAALVGAIEGNCVSRLGNAITVQSIKLVGRST